MSSTDRVLINSLPKSGTHLLAKAIEVLGYQEHFENGSSSDTPIFLNYREVKNALKNEKISETEDAGEKISIGALTPCYVKASTFRHWLDIIPQKRYILGHIPWTPVLSPILGDLKYHYVFIIRDPRAVVASSMPFILDTGNMPAKHFLEDDFKLMSPMERLNFILEGGYAQKAGVEIKNFAEVYRSMLAWRNEPGCLFVRFEDLVGEQGGGSSDKQMDVIKNIASHLGIEFDAKISSQIEEIYNPSSRTFRMGKIDGWKNSLDAESLERLIEYCKPLCQEAGYETF
jgi:hypothetical protein